MENKRLSNKLNSVFWFVLTTLPIIFLLFSIIMAISSYNRANLTYSDMFNINTFLSDTDFWNNSLTIFEDLSISSLQDTFDSLFQFFELGEYHLFSIIFAYMLSIQVYHLIYDVLKFIIGWCHHLIEKAYF